MALLAARSAASLSTAAWARFCLGRLLALALSLFVDSSSGWRRLNSSSASLASALNRSFSTSGRCFQQMAAAHEIVLDSSNRSGWPRGSELFLAMKALRNRRNALAGRLTQLLETRWLCEMWPFMVRGGGTRLASLSSPSAFVLDGARGPARDDRASGSAGEGYDPGEDSPEDGEDPAEKGEPLVSNTGRGKKAAGGAAFEQCGQMPPRGAPKVVSWYACG